MSFSHELLSNQVYPFWNQLNVRFTIIEKFYIMSIEFISVELHLIEIGLIIDDGFHLIVKE